VVQLLSARVEKGKNHKPNTPIENIFRIEIPMEEKTILLSINTGVMASHMI